MVNSTPMLLVDCSHILHTAKHAMVSNRLSNNGIETSVIFSFVSQLFSLSKKFNSNHFVFAFDSEKSLRREIYPTYKLKRNNAKKEKTDQERYYDQVCYDQFNEIRDVVLPMLGFKNLFFQEGLEADDIVASIVRTYEKEIAIVSSDKDLYQLLSEGNGKDVYIYNIKTKKKYRKSDLYEEFGVTPDQWWQLLCIKGCDTDEVHGIPDVGYKTASKYLNEKLSARDSKKRLIDSPASKRIIERNIRLVKLPFEGTGVFSLVEDDLSLSKFQQMCHKYGFVSMLKTEKVLEWKTCMGVTK